MTRKTSQTVAGETSAASKARPTKAKTPATPPPKTPISPGLNTPLSAERPGLAEFATPAASAALDNGSLDHAVDSRWGNPYRATFTCPDKGFELGENHRFRQVVFYFRESPDLEVKMKLKEAGFIYRPAEKGWTLPATAANRELAATLAREFKGVSTEKQR